MDKVRKRLLLEYRDGFAKVQKVLRVVVSFGLRIGLYNKALARVWIAANNTAEP